MKLFTEKDYYKLYNGSVLDMLEHIDECSIDSIVTDPPYELNFMGNQWDKSGIAYNIETWHKCYKVLKPGGYLLAFGGSRTFHRIACAIEDAGFEIRDTIMWLYGSGFPKSMNISKAIEAQELYGNTSTSAKKLVEQNGDGEEYTVKQTNNGCIGETFETTRKTYKPQSELAQKWEGWGTTLKPAYEPIIVARKPLEENYYNNLVKYNTGGINIQECRIETDDYLYNHGSSKGTIDSVSVGNFNPIDKAENDSTEYGRFPSNVILTYDKKDFNEVCGGMPFTKSSGGKSNQTSFKNIYGEYQNKTIPAHSGGLLDKGSAGRYFYCAKATNKDRDEGLEDFETIKTSVYGETNEDGEFTGIRQGRETTRKNIHPTVKPTTLMQYLIRLVTPKGGIVLDPFNGSGSTGKGAMYENMERNKNYTYIGIDISEEYLNISEARLDNVLKVWKSKLF